jgi:uncharacterized protein (TIGR03086 family)
MTDWPDLLARTYRVVRDPLAQVHDALLDRPTPCEQWTLGDLVDHLVGAIDMFAATAGAPTQGARASSPVDRFDSAVERNLAAWSAAPNMQATVRLPFGEFPAELAAGMNQLDSLVHGWDVAASLGLPFEPPDELAEVGLQTGRISVPPSRGYAFGAALAPHDDRPGERLLAFTGRDTQTWPGAIWVAGSLVTVKPSYGDPSAASAVEIWEHEGSGPPTHVHVEHDEIWYVLDGQFTFAIGEQQFQAGPGALVVGPRGVPHTFRADTPHSRMLDIHSPGGFERFFIQAGAPATALTPPEPTDTNGAMLRATIEAFGACVVGPPISAQAKPTRNPAR